MTYYIESQMQLLNKFRPIVYELVTVHFSVQGQTNLVAEKSNYVANYREEILNIGS